MAEVENDGRFKKGQSGNPRGRPSKRKTTHRTSAGYRATMLEVGAMPVQVTDNVTREIEEISLLRANMIALGRKGATGHAPSAKLFLEKHAEAAGIHGELTTLTRFLFEETSKLELEVEALRAMVSKSRGGGPVHVEIPPEEWMKAVGAKEDAWRDRKVFVEPKPR